MIPYQLITFFEKDGIISAQFSPCFDDELPSYEELDAIIAATKKEKHAHTKEEIKKRNEYIMDSMSDRNFERNLDYERTYRPKSDFLEKVPIPKKKEYGYIYLLKSNGLYKVGRAKNPKDRLKTYKTENPFGIEIVHQERVFDYESIEITLHKHFAHKLKLGKEWFELEEDDIVFVKDFLRESNEEEEVAGLLNLLDEE